FQRSKLECERDGRRWVRLDRFEQCGLDHDLLGREWNRQWYGYLLRGGKYHYELAHWYHYGCRPNCYCQSKRGLLLLYNYTDQCFFWREWRQQCSERHCRNWLRMGFDQQRSLADSQFG